MATMTCGQSHKVVAWTALPHRCFISAPKIQSGILKLGYGASLKNLEVLETPGQQPCVALSEVQE